MNEGWVEVGRYLRRNQAEERSLVLMAQGIAYSIEEHDGLHGLLVHPANAERALAELNDYEEERAIERQHELEEARNPPPPLRRLNPTSLFVYVWIMIGCFLFQSHAPAAWVERGAASSKAILSGELWRVITALTLHGDTGHLVANILVGLLFSAALLPLLGVGWTWLAILLSGAIGNLLNAWGFRGGEHLSVGASTAIFGALGILVGWRLLELGQQRRLARWRALTIPIAGGLALLAYLGTGDGMEGSRVDTTAHLFGMLAGVGLGLLLAGLRLPERTSPAGQRWLVLLTLLLPVIAWAWAWAGIYS